MDRIFYIASSTFLFALAALLGWRFLADPLAPKRQWLADQIANVPPAGSVEEDQGWDFTPWQGAIDAKPALWKELVPPPPEKVEVKKVELKQPDLAKMLQGVRASTRQVGNSVFMAWPGNVKGSYVKQGGLVGGCTVKEFDKKTVTFSYFWKEGKKEILYKIPRERRIN
ncbi:MAG: hypothetical protein HYV26_01395 [Candidatus Hydrogenedentes bacterium]|nr:hypothetical protein [Candidatus Hydrogenedentota bacterium]MBI3117443.1 hypothetical protein [Candidatus Hydrogenedentota bacterium]